MGNAWTFSYESIAAPVVLNPSTTRDSGTIKWEIYSNAQTEETFVIGVKQTRNLIRRTVMPSDCTSVYDSVFTPPRTTIDSVTLIQAFSGANDISFAAATCPFAVHDPTITMPAGLSSKDTTVSFQGTTIAGKKMIVSICSCLNAHLSYSFTLGPSIGPIEAYIRSVLPGSSYQETWILTNREYPTAVLKGNAQAAVFKTVAASQSSGMIFCSLNLGHSSPVQLELMDLKGRLIKTLFKGNLTAGEHRFSWDIPTRTRGIALFRVRTGAEDQYVQIMTDAQ